MIKEHIDELKEIWEKGINDIIKAYRDSFYNFRDLISRWKAQNTETNAWRKAFKGILKIILMILPGFVVVLLCPISKNESYNWLYGIWHGWFGLCNIIISLVSTDTYYCAPLGTDTYYVTWRIFFVWSMLVLLGHSTYFILGGGIRNLLLMYTNSWQMLRLKAKMANSNVAAMVLKSAVKVLLLTIPGFVIVLLIPIKADVNYDWFSGVWHGWFGLCNMIISYFSPDTLYRAYFGSSSYIVCWWVFCVLSVLSLIVFFISSLLTFDFHGKYVFVKPQENMTYNLENSAEDIIERSSIEKHIIKVFISSTFRDMQAERDYLMNKTFPLLQNIAKRHRVKFIPIDLRWGITEEESKSGKVLELCLQEIDNSTPFFIGIIGHRYGWCPTIDDFSKSKVLSKRYPWIEEDFRQGLSVTEIEMQYGVLRRKERINAVFFSTNSTVDVAMNIDDNSDSGKIARLKRAILKDGRYQIRSILSPEEFGKEVQTMYEQFLNQYFPLEEKKDDLVAEPAHTELFSLFDEKPKSERILLVNDYLKQFGKKLTANQVNKIVAHKLCDDKIILKDILDELLMFGDFERLDEHLSQILSSETPSDVYQHILRRLEIQFGEKNVKRFLSTLRLAEYGLSMKDAIEIAQVNYDDYPISVTLGIKTFAKDFMKALKGHQPFEEYFMVYLYEKNGLCRLTHINMAAAIDERYLQETRYVRKYRNEIVDCLYAKISSFNADSPKNIGRIEEIAYQYLRLNEYKEMLEFLHDDVHKKYFKQYNPELYNQLLEWRFEQSRDNRYN